MRVSSVVSQGFHSHDLSNPNYLPDIITLGVVASMYKCGVQTNIQSITYQNLFQRKCEEEINMKFTDVLCIIPD